MAKLKKTFFKFLKNTHASSMLEKGEIYLPNLYSFRGGEDNNSLTIDPQEGDATVTKNMNKYFTYLPDIWCYCVTQVLFSDTLQWAIEEGKDSCVMILDGEQFLTCINDALPHILFSEWGSCIYSGKEIDISDINKTLSNIEEDEVVKKSYFCKEKCYEKQREARFIGVPDKGEDEPRGLSPIGVTVQSINLPPPQHPMGMLEPLTLTLPALKDILMEVEIRNVDTAILNGDKKGHITYGFEYKNSSSPTVIKGGRSFSEHTPITDGKYLMIGSRQNDDGKIVVGVDSIGEHCGYLAHNTDEGITGFGPSPH